tara:strand:- start:7799 stop:8200 length:402 start_codon:yes stop_codon:yes gene_type:complete
MSDAKSNYLENKVLDHFLGTTESSFVTQKYLALHTADPTDAGSGAEVANSNNYSRQAINFNAASSGSATSNGAVEFTANSSGGFGTVTHFGIWDSGTHGAGNLIYYGQLTASKTIAANDTLRFADTNITISET